MYHRMAWITQINRIYLYFKKKIADFIPCCSSLAVAQECEAEVALCLWQAWERTHCSLVLSLSSPDSSSQETERPGYQRAAVLVFLNSPSYRGWGHLRKSFPESVEPMIMSLKVASPELLLNSVCHLQFCSQWKPRNCFLVESWARGRNEASRRMKAPKGLGRPREGI